MSTEAIMMLIMTGISVAASVVVMIVVVANKSQKREVTPGFVGVNKEEFDRHTAWNAREHENLFSKLGGVERGAQAKLEKVIHEGNESREKLNERINELLPQMGELSRNVELLNQRMG